MTVDKTALKKLIDRTKPNEILVFTVSSLDKDSTKKLKTELDKFLSQGSEFMVCVSKQG